MLSYNALRSIERLLEREADAFDAEATFLYFSDNHHIFNVTSKTRPEENITLKMAMNDGKVIFHSFHENEWLPAGEYDYDEI